MVPTAGGARDSNACRSRPQLRHGRSGQSDDVTTIILTRPPARPRRTPRPRNAANLTDAEKLVNGSDNALIDGSLSPTLGALLSWRPRSERQHADDLTGARRTHRRPEPAEVAALVPENDEMALDANGDPTRPRPTVAGGTRSGADQRAERPDQQPGEFFRNLVGIRPRSWRLTRPFSPRTHHRCRRWARTCSPSWPTGSSCPSPTSAARTSASPTP